MATAFTMALLAGFAGSFHCLGMCGGFACGLGHGRAGGFSSALVRNLLYNLGRLATYAFIGALAGALGAAVVGQPAMPMVLAGEVGLAQRVLAAVAGALMLLMGLELLGVRRHVPRSWAAIGGETFAGILSTLLRAPGPAAPLALGVANGFLPCPLVYAFAATAAATGAVGPGVLTMVAFGLGTFPAMLFMASVGMLLSPRVRRSGVRAAGAFVLVIAVITAARGLPPSLLHGGHALAMP